MFTFPSALLRHFTTLQRHVKTQKRPILTQQHLLATSMSQQIRDLTIIFIPDPPLAHTVTSSKKGTPFEMARLFDPESAKHLFQSAPGCWLDKERAGSADDGEENADASHELVEDCRQLVNDGRETVDASKEAAHAGEGITDAGDDTAEGGQNSRIARDMIIWEWAYLPETWRTLSEAREDLTVNVVGMDYPHFMSAIMSRSEENDAWRTLLDADLVVGGAALNEDFMNPLYLLNHDPQGLHRYLNGMDILAEHTPIWPLPKALLSTGNKFLLARTLDQIATEVTHTPRPRTRPLPTGPVGCVSAGFIHKRGYSAHSDHVILGRRTGSDDPLSALKPSGSALIDMTWHEQEYVHTLRNPQYGELRCYVVGGRMSRVLKTVPIGDKVLQCKVIAGLPTLQYLLDDHRGQNVDDDTGDAGMRELEEFVLATHAALVDKERQRPNATRTDLEVLCRIDVGVLIAESAAHYFVLEVERGLTTCMFAYEDQEGAAADIEEVAKLLLGWVG